MSPVPFRPLAAAVLVAGLFLALPGCSGGKPQPSDKGKEKDKGGGDPVALKGDGKTDPGGAPKAPAKVDFDAGVGKEAMDFLKSVADGTVKADRLSVPFLKAVGLPLTLEGDKAKGYSADEAVSWLKRVVSGVGVPFPSQQVGDVALIRGGVTGGGRYALRLVKDGGAWKADALALSSAKVTSPPPAATTGEAALQEFVAASFAELLADKSAMPPQERAMAAAAFMTPALRAKWAEPSGSDKTAGFDYSRGALVLKLKEFEADALAVAQQGDAPVFRVEFDKGGAKKAYLVKLAKDAAGRWLVDDVTPA